MATKYNRETEASEGSAGRRTPWIRQGSPHRPLSRRQRTFIIFMGLTVIVLLLLIAQRLNQDAPYRFQPVLRGQGTIVALEGGDESASTEIVVEIEVAGMGPVVLTRRMPRPYWSAFEIGDRVAVRYRVSERRTSVQLVECGMVALSESNR
jgi:hypothetical protein